MSQTSGSGFRPWQRPDVKPDVALADARESSPDVGNQPAYSETNQQHVQSVVEDVLDRTHRAVNEQKQAVVSERGLRQAVQASRTVALHGTTLTVGATTLRLETEHASALTILAPQRQMLLAMADALSSGAPALISTPDGVDVGATARWFLDATGSDYRHQRISRMTSLDALAGALRPDASGRLRVHHGPLTECIMNGGTFIADGIDQAEKDVLAVLTGLAKGTKEFHHPVSGRIIDVHPKFRLVLATSNKARFASDLTSACALTEVQAYTRDDHIRLLTERVGLRSHMAATLADIHELVKARQFTDKPEDALEYGRGFPLAWPLLERVAKRVRDSDMTPQSVSDAFWGLYGARLASREGAAAFTAILRDAGWPVPRSAPEADATAEWKPLPHQAQALFQAELAHKAGEAVLLVGAGQSGVTTLIEELGRRFDQDVVTITCHPGIDPQSLVERPIFKEDGSVEFVPGVITEARLSGKILCFEHVDHMSTDLQEAVMRLVEQKTIAILEDGKLVDKPVHPNSRIYFSATAGLDRSRRTPPARERALVTEIRLGAPELADAFATLAPSLKPELRASIERIEWELLAENPHLGLLKLQRFRDFVGAATLLAEHISPDDATVAAARLLFDPAKSKVLASQPETPELEPPLWLRVMGLTSAEVQARVARTGYHLVPSMREYLLPLAIASKLSRPVLTVGPAAAGKTVLGVVWAAIAEKKATRFNFSAATETADLYGGLGPVNVDGRVRFMPVTGPLLRATLEDQGVWIGDERNLNTEAMLSQKSLLDHRRAVLDPDTGLPRGIGSSILYYAENPVGTRGRQEQPPVIDDCMFRVVVRAKPVEERADIVASQCGLARNWKGAPGGLRLATAFDPVLSIAKFFEDLDVVWREHRSKLGATEGPITCTERDMLKVARRVEYLIARDGITDSVERRRVLGRETFRMLRGLLKDAESINFVYESLIKKHFGNDVPRLERPEGVTFVEVMVDGVPTKMMKIGAARYPVRTLDDALLQSLVPGKERIGEPVGAQLEFLEDALLALELNQPLAIVGITGSGKTMLVRYLAHHLNQPLLEQAYHADMTEENIFGTTVLTPEGDVKFQESPLDIAAQIGAWYVGDELLTLPNKTRESLNPVTEGSEIQIPSRPPRTLKRPEWHPHFRQIFTTNGDDIRADGFSEPEASRLVIVGIREPRGFDDLNSIAQRDYGPGPSQELYRAPTVTTKTRRTSREALLSLVPERSPIAELLALACVDVADTQGVTGFFRRIVKAVRRDDARLTSELPAVLANTPALQLDDKGERIIADALWAFREGPYAEARELLSALVFNARDPRSAARIAAMAPVGALSAEALRHARANAMDGDRLVAPAEVAKLTALFDQLRDLQAGEGVSPLTPRLLSSFLELYIEKRRSTEGPAAAMRAAELTLLSKLPKHMEAEAVSRVVAAFGDHTPDSVELLVPRHEPDGVWFGNTQVALGREAPWRPSNERFPLTPARVQNLACIADAEVMGRGRPISLTDDANGESMETLREYARLVGKRLVVAPLTPNTDIEQLIEKLVLTDDPTIKGGFAPELQEIAQAVKEGHLLALRGCGTVPSSKLERLNSLGDGRQSIELPRSARVIKADSGFRMFMLRKPGSPHQYSPALENRLLEPLLSTRSQVATQEVLSRNASELLENIHHRTQISVESARLLARFHVCLNELLRKGEFASSHAVGSFLNGYAEAVARRLKHLTVQDAVTDEVETLHRLVVDVYGERFDNDSDRTLFLHLAKQFISDKMAAPQAPDLSASQHFVRFGDWSVPRDSRGIRADVPGLDALLPRIEGLDDIQNKMFAAAQFGETIQVHGDGFVGRAAVLSLARLASSEVIEVEANEELSESSLFGGLVQNDSGQFERYDGLLWRAQSEGAILFIKNAARLPRDVLMRLSETAATDNIERVKDGKLEIQQKRLRLILQTSSGDPALPSELAGVCTRVRCAPVTAHRDLVALTSHVLEGVPGGAEMAVSLVELVTAADTAMAGVSLQGRQPIRFDGQRLLFMAGDIAKGAKDPAASLEQVVAAAVARHVTGPLEGLPVAVAVDGAVDALLKRLYGTSGVLTAQASNAIDVVASPHLAALKKDYDHIVGSFTGTLVKAAAEALTRCLQANDGKALFTLLNELPLGRLLPLHIERGFASALASMDLGAEIPAKVEKQVRSLIDSLDSSQSSVTTLETDALEFMRGARLWDLEHRLEVIRRYSTAFELCGGHGSEVSAPAGEALERVRERFDGAAAEKMVADIRGGVEQAMADYKVQSGGTDNVLHERYEKVVERWDMVTGTPLFKSHHQLRGHLTELQAALDALRHAHDDRGAPRGEVAALLKVLRSAGERLEGLRIAEQSADLRRDVATEQLGTKELVDEFLKTVTTIKELRAVKDQYALLTRNQRFSEELVRADLFSVPSGRVEVERPASRTKEDLTRAAAERAETIVREFVVEQRQRLFAKLGETSTQKAAPSPADFFNDYDLRQADVGLARPNGVTRHDAQQRTRDEGLRAIENERDQRAAVAQQRVFAELKHDDEQYVERLYRERLNAAIDRTATRISRSSLALSRDLQKLGRDLNLDSKSEASLAIEHACALLKRSEKAGEEWGEGFRRKLSFKNILGSAESDAPVPEGRSLDIPDTSDARAAVTTALALVGESIALELAGLPDVSRLDEHIAHAASLSESLASAETLGQLSSRFSMLDATTLEAPETKQLLQALLGRVAGTSSLRELLLRIAAFSETADTLSSKVSTRTGVAVQLAQVVEAVMRAAQLIRQQPVRDQSTRACLNALDQVLARFDELEKNRTRVPDVLISVRSEVTELRQAFAGAISTAKSLELKDAGLDAFLDVLSVRSPDLASAERIRAAMVQVDVVQSDVNDASALVVTQVARPATTGASGVQRDTELRLIDLSTVGLKAAAKALSKAEPADNKVDGTAVKQIAAAVTELQERAVVAAERVVENRSAAGALLDKLEHGFKAATAHRARDLLATAAEALEIAVKGETGDHRTNASKAISAIGNVLAIIEPSDVFAREHATRLRTVLDKARVLDTTFDATAVERLVFSVCGDALASVKETQYAIAELTAALGSRESKVDANGLIGELARIVEAQATAPELLTAWSRHACLASWAARLDGIVPVLSGSAASSAQEVANKARELALALAKRVPSVIAERCLAETLASVAEIGQHAVASKKLELKHAADFVSLMAVINAMCLSPKAISSEDAVDAAKEVVARAQPFAGFDNKNVPAAARDLEHHIDGFVNAVLRTDALRVTQTLADGAGAYLSVTLQAEANVNAACAALIGYDPTSPTRVETLAQNLATAIGEARKALRGPYEAKLGNALVAAFDALDAAKGRPGIGAEASRLLRDHGAVRKDAQRSSASAAAAEQYDHMLLRLRGYLDNIGRASPTGEVVERAEAIVKAVLDLNDRTGEAMTKRLNEVLEKYFRGAVRGLELEQKAAAIEASPVEIATPIRSSVSANAELVVTGSETLPAAPSAPAASDGATGPATENAEAAPPKPPQEPDKDIDDSSRHIVGEGVGSAEALTAIEVSDEAVQGTLDAMQTLLAAVRSSGVIETNATPQTAFEQFIAAHQDLVLQLRQVLRKFPAEIVVIVDQSGSTDGTVISHERAVVALIMAAVMGGEGNCAIVGMGDRVGVGTAVPGTGEQVWMHKAMKSPLTATIADAVYALCAKAAGGTELIPPIKAGLGQFTTKGNDKLVLIMTDAEVENASAVRAVIEEARAKGVGVAMMGFGAAKNIQTVAGNFGIHVKSFKAAVEGAAELLTRTLVSNQGRFKGAVQSSSNGIGTAFIDTPMAAAPSGGPMGAALRLNQPLSVAEEPREVFGGEGSARELDQLVTRPIYDAACKNLEAIQRQAQPKASYRQCLQEVRELASRHSRDGTDVRLREAISMTLPRAGGTELLRKQVSGPLLDEEQLPLYTAGLAQGMPVLRIFKKKKGSEEIRAKVVLMIDESSSMGDSDKMRANLEALIAYGDALKAIDPNIEIAVLGYSDRVRLHAHFEQEWNDELKAHLLHQIRGEYEATDDERGTAEAIGLLDMMETEVGQILNFTDGQGLPGTHELVKQATIKGYNMMVVGIGAECKGVLQFNERALYARNMSLFIQQYPSVSLRGWELVGRPMGAH